MESQMDTLTDPLRKRGRQSAASLSVITPDVIMQHPQPPERLTRQQKELWRSIVEKVRPAWFLSSEALLETYVVVVSQQRELEECIKAVAPASRRWIELVRLHRAVVMTAGNLATKLRLTPRSTVDRYTPKVVSPVPGKLPWEPGAELDDDEPPAA
jgi:hypothetical protein